MKRFFKTSIVLLFAILGLGSNNGWGQLVAWNNSSLSGITATPLNATTNDANLNTAVLSRGAGITATSLTGGYASSGWNVASEAAAISGNLYYQCTISAKTGFAVSLTTLDAKLRRTGTGPNAYIWRYSTDGSSFTDIGTPTSFTTTTSTGDVQPQISLSAITALQNVPDGTVITLRLYAWGASAAGGTLSFGTGNVNSLAIGGTVAANVPSPTTTSISPSSATAGDPSFTITVNGSNFINGSSTVTWNGANRTTTFISASQLTALINAADIASPGTFAVGVTTAGAPSASNTQAFTVNPGTSPSIVLTASLSSFGNICINTVSGPNSFTLDGTNLDGSNITLAALPGFSYSETVNGAYTSTLSFSYTGNSFSGKQLYVQFNPTAVQSYDGNISITGGGIAGLAVPAAGAGVNAAPSVTTGSTSAIMATTATVAGSIADPGCSSVTSYGIEYSTSSGFPNGTGTQVPSSNLSGSNFSVSLSGLAPNTRYYYKAYATNAGGTTYGSQQAFNAGPLPVLMSAQPGFSYTQDFADIATWTNFFISGNGANHFTGLSAGGTGTIPNPTVLTASTSTFQGSLSSGGVQRGTDQSPSSTSIVLLSTGSGDNTSSAAIDFYMDFTGLNAGTLSFDWASINNATGDRNGSLRVYASTDGISFTELSFADVLNVTNNAATSGSKSNIALPAFFNNSATARLRFYYHNGTGGSTGSRPKISIDNLKVTAVATTPCSSPTAPATALAFGTITDVSIQGSFTAASPVADGYLVIASTSSSLTSNPVDGQLYNIGDNVGDGTVVANGNSTSFTASGLNASTTYYFFVFPVNSICTGGPLYYTATVLSGQATTNAGLPSCTAPASQPASLVFGSVTPNSIQGSFNVTTADEYLVLASTSSTLSNTPVTGQAYTAGDVIGNATVVMSGNASSFIATGLNPSTTYYFFVFSFNSQNCVNGPAYNTVSPLSGSQATQALPPCTTPVSQPSTVYFNASSTMISGSYTAGTGADAYLVVGSTSSTLSSTPVDNTDYNIGDNLGGGVVVANSAATSFVAPGLTPGTTYYFFIFAANKNCAGGTKYLVTSPLTGSKATSSSIVSNYYFGTLHAHSDYSDGNQDHPGYTPTDDYTYALTAQCMDYLGISEHNHFSTTNNPGNQIANYHSGSVEADNFSATHSNFLALYGMEWGVISGGGHVVIYGDGMNDLWGWESGSGAWGATNNYDTYVAKSDYTGANGLFKTINDNVAKNTFATLAHPNFTDYNNLANIAYDAVADNAITGAAVESGPATSTNTSYTDPGSSMYYLNYYQAMLAKGYHLGPTIDHDNHKTTFGHTTYSRTAVVAPALTKTEIIRAFREMHFYATEDCDSKVDFTINTKQMGSSFTDRSAPIIYVALSDATTNVSNAVINIMYGVPGSGASAQKIASVTGSSMTYVDKNLPDLATGYYYIDISNGNARIITAPVWYTRNDNMTTLPVQLASFTAQKLNASVQLNWTTAQEINTREFIVERMVNSGNWEAIARVAANAGSNAPVNYSVLDAHPGKGKNRYRLKMVDQDGKFEYSVIRYVDFNTAFLYTVYPNPAAKTLTIATDNSAGSNANVQVLNMQSQAVVSKQFHANSQPMQLDISALRAGVYFLKIVAVDGSVHMEKFVKQ